jgi:hypothetical protein
VVRAARASQQLEFEQRQRGQLIEQAVDAYAALARHLAQAARLVGRWRSSFMVLSGVTVAGRCVGRLGPFSPGARAGAEKPAASSGLVLRIGHVRPGVRQGLVLESKRE